MNPVDRPIRFFAICTALCLLAFTAMRIVFYAVFAPPSDPLSWPLLARAFYIGLKFDLRLAVLINLPMLLLSWIKPLNPYAAAWARRGWIAWMLAVGVIVTFIYIADFGNYGYLHARLDILSVKLLENPSIALGMVWETYPVVWIFLGLVILAALTAWGMSWMLRRLARAAPSSGPRWLRMTVSALTGVLCAAALYGKYSFYPLRWSDAFFDPHPFASALALNPVLYFLETLKIDKTPYDLERVRKNYPLMAEYLGVDKPDPEKLNFVRRVPGKAEGKPAVNVVIVLLESFASFKTGLSGNPLDGSPNFDRIAREGLYFSRYYVPVQGTARSIFALITGIPDVESHGTSTRNPLVVHQHTIIEAFRGHDKYYFLGGSLNWANIRGLLSQNIPGLKIYEEGSYDKSRTDVWGISDLHLLEEANLVFAKSEKPFFAIIQTAGNHRPYTIPKDNRGFVLQDLPDEAVIPYGFISTVEFNSFRFLDHAIGNFIETARKEKYFENTVFVFLGDHGVPGRADHMPKSEELLDLGCFHVPLLFYGPGVIPEPKQCDVLAGEPDVLPTLASLLSMPYVNSTLGRDLLDPRFDSSRHAFTAVFAGARRMLGLVGPDYYFRISSEGTERALYDPLSENPRENLLERRPERAAEMERLLQAIHETARYIRYHNAPDHVQKIADEGR